MSKLYKRANLLVSRSYYHGGDGLENGGICFFRSLDEYHEEAEKKGWESGKSLGSSWCVKPVLMEVLISPKDLARFQRGDPVPELGNKVFFASRLVTKVHQIGGWQG